MYIFCPFCGQKLPQGPASFVFCPFCGKGLTEETKPVQQPAINEETAAEMIEKPLQSTIQAVERKAETTPHAASRQVETCHLILKDCSSPDLLKRRLTGILLRSPLAIQMAVDRLPSMLLYKSRTTELPAVIAVFRETKSALTVLDAMQPERKTDLQGALAAAGRKQEWISSLPEILWQGEQRVEFVATVNADGQENLLLLGVSNLFLVDATSWKAKTLALLEKVLLQPEGRLRIDEWQIQLASEEDGAKAYARIKREMTRARKQWLFQTRCNQCAAVTVDDSHTVTAKVELCSQCGGSCSRSTFEQNEG